MSMLSIQEEPIALYSLDAYSYMAPAWGKENLHMHHGNYSHEHNYIASYRDIATYSYDD